MKQLSKLTSISETRPSGYALKFSVPFGIAMILLREKAGIDEFAERNYRNEEVLELASKVKIMGYESDEFPKHLPGWVRIAMKDGTIYEHRIKFERGSLDNPTSDGEIRAKYYDNALRALPSEKVKKIENLIDELENLDDVSKLMRLCY
jgi:2-methylcitrate dehydratase PrpD